jgi:hypothetical protein
VVAGKHVTTVHSEKRDGQPAIIGMYISGEVIAAQELVKQMGAASVDSLVLCRRDDQAVGQALRKYARYAIEHVEISRPASSPKQSPHSCLLWMAGQDQRESVLTAPNGGYSRSAVVPRASGLAAQSLAAGPPAGEEPIQARGQSEPPAPRRKPGQAGNEWKRTSRRAADHRLLNRVL